MKKIRTGGGWPAVRYAIKMARQSGGLIPFWKALRTRNACKTCALGMGGQLGGMVDESGHFPEVCKKSMQAMAADMQAPIPAEFFERNGFSELQALTPRELEGLGRLTTPVMAGPDDRGYRPVSWDSALEWCAQRLKATSPDHNFFYVSGRSSNEAGFLLQLFVRMYGTNQINNCSYYCHQASGEGLKHTLGTGTATVVLEDLTECDTFFLIGGNPSSNHPRLMRQLMQMRRRGGEVIVINPLVETGLVNFSVPSDIRSLMLGSSIASLYVQPHIGGDIALLCGVAKALDALGAIDKNFLNLHTTGSDEWLTTIRKLEWSALIQQSGVSRDTLEDIARRYARSERSVFAWTMGITHHRHGVANVEAIVNLALSRGMIGQRGAGMLPIRGHSNVQGMGSVGVTPALKKEFFDRLEAHFGITLPQSLGMDTLACMEAMEQGRIHNAWCLGGNLFGASPDSHAAASSFAELESVVYVSTTLNNGHAWGRGRNTLILPVLPRDEEAQRTTQESMFNYVRISDGGATRHEGPRSEVDLVVDLAERVLPANGPIPWGILRDHAQIRNVIADVVPGYGAIAQIDETAKEFQIENRTFHEPRFNTPDGRAHMHTTPLPDLPQSNNQLRLMTIRSEGQFNTVVYEEEDLYRHQERRDVILMHGDDITRFGLSADQPVTVRSSTGFMRDIRVREFDIRSGNAAMYFPEANILVPKTADPRSRTPAFKNILITLEA